MKLEITASPKEIAALVLALQERQAADLYSKVMHRLQERQRQIGEEGLL